MDVLATTSRVAALVGSAITLIQQVQRARDSINGASKTLENITKQLDALVGTLNLAMGEERLQTASVEQQLHTIIEVAEELKGFFDKIKAEQQRKAIRQFFYALKSGDKNDIELVGIFDRLDRARLELVLRITLAQVGMLDNLHDGFRAAFGILQDTNTNVKQILGHDRNPAVQVKDKQPEQTVDWTVRIDQADVKALGLDAAPEIAPDHQAIELEAEADDHVDDNDSVLWAGSASSTTSIRSSIVKHCEENGRTYHSYKEGKYILPNDKSENDRLDLQHHLFTLTFDGKLFNSPIVKEKQIHRVLDAGTGTGTWAIDFADERCEAQVLGVDLSPVQPLFIPPNVTFQIDDLEDTWTFSDKFDFIYSRMMTGSFTDWPRFFEQSFKNLTPGGYIEIADICFPVHVDDESLPVDSALNKWSDLMLEASRRVERPINSAKSYKLQLKTAGFNNVVEVQYKWPQNRWPKDPKFKVLGMWNLENMAPSLEGLSIALFTRVLGWSKQEVEAFLVDVRREMEDPKIHAYWVIYVVYGQKLV